MNNLTPGRVWLICLGVLLYLTVLIWAWDAAGCSVQTPC